MEYARKMVLVLQDVYDAMQTVKTAKNEVKEDKMHTILEDPKLPLDHKMKIYNHELLKAIDQKVDVQKDIENETDMEADFNH